jgi:hypothetical protein
MDIAGFIVVYRQGCTRPWEPGNIVVPRGRLGSIFNGGVHREPWDALHEHYRARTLPAWLLEARERMRAPRTYLGLEVCQDVKVASELLAFSRTTRPDSELIAVRSRLP